MGIKDSLLGKQFHARDKNLRYATAVLLEVKG
jgi:hypothetical protein